MNTVIPTSGISQSDKELNLNKNKSKNEEKSLNRLNFTVTTQRIILNVFHAIAKTHHQSIAVKKTSELTNIDIPTIYTLIKEGIQTKKSRLLPVSPVIATAIENAIQELQSSHKSLSIKTIVKVIKLRSPEIKGSPAMLRLWMKKLGYKYALIPQKFSSRQEVKDFLVAHNLPFEETYSKKELLAVVTRYKFKAKRYILYKSKPVP